MQFVCASTWAGQPIDQEPKKFFGNQTQQGQAQARSDQIICGLQGLGRAVGWTMRGHEPKASPVRVCLRGPEGSGGPDRTGPAQNRAQLRSREPHEMAKDYQGFGL